MSSSHFFLTRKFRYCLISLFLLGIALGSCFSRRAETIDRNNEVGKKAEEILTTAATTASSASQVCLPDFSDLVQKVQPAVVNVWTTRRVRTVISPFGDPELLPPPFRDFFRRFFPEHPDFPRREGELKQFSLGSGFIIDPEGIAVTNNHVIQEAEEIKITASDGKSYDVEILGKDPQTDLALLRIKGKGPFPYLQFGDSDATRVGEWVVAVGNPFGLSHTVTVGIISAKGRTIRQGPYDDFLQTDASINPGNSGGPLLNIQGKVIGVNTAIFSRTGQSAGIGFAIPSNIARYVVEELKKHKRVVRGYLGVLIQPVDETLAKAMGLPEPKGALVSQVYPQTPAEKAGIKKGDLIVKFNGAEIVRFNELPLKVSTTPPGTPVTVEVIREGKLLTFKLTLAELPENLAEAQERNFPGGEEGEPSQPESSRILGMRVRSLTAEERQQLGNIQSGILVEEVEDGSPAQDAQIKAGDIILEANRTPLNTPEDLRRALAQAKGKGASAIVLYVRQGNQNRFIGIHIQ